MYKPGYPHMFPRPDMFWDQLGSDKQNIQVPSVVDEALVSKNKSRACD